MASPMASTLKRLMKQEAKSRNCVTSPAAGVKRRAEDDMIQGFQRIHNPVWRQMVVEWCYLVIDHISADRELVYITMNILDRFLVACHSKKSKTPKYCYLTDKKAYETAVMTALLMTLKLQGISALCVKDLVKMSSNSVSSKEIVEVGKDIVQTLTWNTQIPTAARFAHALVDSLPESIGNHTKISIFENIVYQIELSVQDEYCSRQPPSLVAWMAFENAICYANVPRHTKISVRSQIAEDLSMDYNFDLCAKLQNFQKQSRGSASIPDVIPPDEDEKCTEISSEGGKILSLRSRPFSECTVISLEDMAVIPLFPQYQDKVSTLRRTKRIRFC